jgi:hypothetical protein
VQILNWSGSDEHSSFLPYLDNYRRKKYICLYPSINLFLFLFNRLNDKLERLCLGPIVQARVEHVKELLSDTPYSYNNTKY